MDNDSTTLWCIHVLGPDTLIAQPDKATAERRAIEWQRSMDLTLGRCIRNARAKDPNANINYFPVLATLVEPWPYTPESHAAQLAEHGGDPEDVI